MRCSIYGLYSTKVPDMIRYVGQTTQELNKRLINHRAKAKMRRNAVACWITKHQNDGYEIKIKTLKSDAEFNVDEPTWIAKYRKLNGDKILNHTDGGEGTVGYKK